MRTALGLVSLLVLMLATASGDPIVTCDGRIAKSCQCDDGKVPSGYYQATKCEGDLPGLGTCKNAIAFNISDFCCTDPATTGNPPQYTTYCKESNASIECTVKQTCAGTTMTRPDGTQYTNCFALNAPITTYRYMKVTLDTTTTPRCDAIIVQP